MNIDIFTREVLRPLESILDEASAIDGASDETLQRLHAALQATHEYVARIERSGDLTRDASTARMERELANLWRRVAQDLEPLAPHVSRCLDVRDEDLGSVWIGVSAAGRAVASLAARVRSFQRRRRN
ncbi:MAG: hypothetical protein KDB80_14205 [Planctomycetes bacterium]|nr:hypothetical protein [Planctomycetota bacterium]